jgi:hypothetical protein
MLDNKEQVLEAKQSIIDSILGDIPSDAAIEVELPSECRIYDLPDPGSPITIRPMTFEDEKIVVSHKKSQDPTNIILERCVTNVRVGDLLSMDKLYLLLKLREISYGDEYNTLLICNHCNAENPSKVNISQLNVNPVPDDFTDPVEVELPTIKKKAKVRLPRVKDDSVFRDGVEAIYDQLWRFVTEIDGHTDKSIIAPVIQKLPLVDIKKIIKCLKLDYGVDTHVKFACNECGEVSVVDLPIDANFFDAN